MSRSALLQVKNLVKHFPSAAGCCSAWSTRCTRWTA
jgi:hypothetical protein